MRASSQDASAFQNLFVAGDGALFAGAVLKGASDGGIYRSVDGISWAPVVELEGLRLDTLNVEEDRIFAAATPASGGVKIYELDSRLLPTVRRATAVSRAPPSV